MGLKATSGAGAGSTTTAERSQAARKRLVGTEQQEAVWSALVDGDRHVEVEALAGTGKSTTLREGAWRLKDSGRVDPRDLTVVSYNKHIADAMGADLPSGCRSQTSHAIGFRLLAPLGHVTVDPYKTEMLAETYFPDRFAEREERRAVARLVSLCKSGLVVDPDDRDELLSLAVSRDVDLGARADDVLDVVPLVLDASRKMLSVVDYDDMLWLPNELDLRPSRPAEILMVDEAQDLSPAQHDLAFRVCPTGRIVTVGDRHQAVYAFRGADAESMDSLAVRLAVVGRGLMRLPLTTTWRCPRSHVDLARILVPGLEAAPNAAEGTIVDIDESKLPGRCAPGDMILCRNNAPLVSTCFALLRHDVRARIRGRDVGKGLTALVRRMRAATISDLVVKLERHRAEQAEKLSSLRNPEAATAALYDKVDCLLEFCLRHGSVDAVLAAVERMFDDADDANSVTLSTVHKAKGLERDRVWIIRPDLLPHPKNQFAKQERNLLYVALTRAKKTLGFAGGRPSPLTGIAGKTDEQLSLWLDGLTCDPSDMGSLD